MPAAVASRYARALADLSSKPESPVQPNRLVEEMQAIERAWASSPVCGTCCFPPPSPRPGNGRLSRRWPERCHCPAC